MTYKISLKPRAEREAMITKRLELSDEFGETIYDFRSDRFTPKVISLPIDTPVYRMENCRTFSAQQTEVARAGLSKDFFEKGQELTTAQQAQHEILSRLAKEGNESITPIIQVLAKDGQRETILITSTGVVVNGNRRLAAMRELKARKDGSVDERFTNIKCAVLPQDVTRDEVDDIEADLQARPQTKLDYDWIGDARLIRRQVGKNRSTKEVADRLRRSKADIENVLQSLDEADLYLSEWVKKPGEYDLLRDGQQIFGDLPKALAKKDANLQNASRAIAWSIYENRDRVSGRVYRLNAAFGKLAPQVLDILEDQLELPSVDGDDQDNDHDFAIDIDLDSESKDYTTVIEALRGEASRDEAVSALIDACETAIQLDSGQKNEEAALKALAQINAKVTGIDISTAGSSTLPAVLKQIGSIRKGLDKIEAAIRTRQAGIAVDDAGQE
jgi:DNA-binding FrmR family transcriptional regulator